MSLDICLRSDLQPAGYPNVSLHKWEDLAFCRNEQQRYCPLRRLSLCSRDLLPCSRTNPGPAYQRRRGRAVTCQCHFSRCGKADIRAEICTKKNTQVILRLWVDCVHKRLETSLQRIANLPRSSRILLTQFNCLKLAIFPKSCSPV